MKSAQENNQIDWKLRVGGDVVKEEENFLKKLYDLPKHFPEQINLDNSSEYKLIKANYIADVFLYLATGQYPLVEEITLKKLNIAVKYASGNYIFPEHIAKDYVDIGSKTKSLDEIISNHQIFSNQSKGPLAELASHYILAAALRKKGENIEATYEYSKCYDMIQGYIDKEAYNIDQREVGYSNSAKIGTTNIQQCVAVIIHDPDTKQSALAHIDFNTSAKSLGKVIDNFPKDKTLNVYLVGARDRTYDKNTSDANVNKIIKEIKRHPNLDIKVADIKDRGSPSAIVFDPKTGELTNAVPAHDDPYLYLRKISLYIDPFRNTLNEAFQIIDGKVKQNKILNFDEKSKDIIFGLYRDKIIRDDSTTLEEANSWRSNVIKEPIIKVVEQISAEDSQFKERIVKEVIAAKIASTSQLLNRDITKVEKELNQAVSEEFKDKQLNNITLEKVINNHLERIQTKQAELNSEWEDINNSLPKNFNAFDHSFTHAEKFQSIQTKLDQEVKSSDKNILQMILSNQSDIMNEKSFVERIKDEKNISNKLKKLNER